MAAHHRLACLGGPLGALARKIVDLRAVGRRPPGGRTASEHERAPDAVVLVVGQRRQPVELRHAGRPQVVGALDHLGHVGRHLVGVLGGERQQVGADVLVDRYLLDAILHDGHQLERLGPHAVLHPLAHLRAAHARDGPLRHLSHDLLDLHQLVAGVFDRCVAQRQIDAHAPVVDALVDVVVGQLFGGQVTQALADGAHGAHVLVAIAVHLVQQRRIVVERPVSARNRQQADQLRPAMVLLHGRAAEAPHVLQRAGRAVGAGLRCRAVELRQRRLADALVGAQDEPKDKPLEGGVVCSDLACVLRDALRERLVRRPCDDLFVVERVGHAQHGRRAVHTIVIHASCAKVATAAAFKVDPANGHDVSQLLTGAAGGGTAAPAFTLPYARRRRRGSAGASAGASATGGASTSVEPPSIAIHSTTSNSGV